MATTRGTIMNTLVEDFTEKFTVANGYSAVVKVFRGGIFSEEIVQFPTLTIDFVADIGEEGDFLGDDSAIRTLTLVVQGGVSTSSNNYDKFDEIMNNCELFLRSDNCSYDVTLEEAIQLEGNHDVARSYFSIQFNIRYNRAY